MFALLLSLHTFEDSLQAPLLSGVLFFPTHQSPTMHSNSTYNLLHDFCEENFPNFFRSNYCLMVCSLMHLPAHRAKAHNSSLSASHILRLLQCASLPIANRSYLLVLGQSTLQAL